MVSPQVSNFLRWLYLIIIAAALVGCAGSPYQTTKRATENKQNMLSLKPDMTIEQVTKLMGPPDKTEMYRGKNNESILSYLYITEGKDLESRSWNESNYTPLIFINGRLSGWGWSALDTEAKRFEFVIKQR